MKAYWFSREDGTTEHQKTPAQIGRTDTVEGELIPCKHGLHASPTPWYGLQYAEGSVLWEVEIPDDSVPHGYPTDKFAARSRTYLRCVDLEHVMREFACRQAESVLHLYEEKYPDDKRLRKAIDAARAYIRGEISDDELDAARDAAWAAWAAWDAAGAAAWAARAACDAAWDAAGAAACDAARDAAWDAAWDTFNEMALAALEEASCQSDD
jgi:hypothetical protein